MPTYLRKTEKIWNLDSWDDTTTANVIYIFEETSEGRWRVRRINTSTGEVGYANGPATSLAAAKADPAGQSYDTFANTF